jgi:hypothetical protein
MKRKSISDQCLVPNQLKVLENLFEASLVNRAKSDEAVNAQIKKNEKSKLKLIDFKRMAEFIKSHHNSEFSLLNLKNFKNKISKYRHKHYHQQNKHTDSNRSATVQFDNSHKENDASNSMVILNVPCLVEQNVNKTNNQHIAFLNEKVDSVKSEMTPNLLRIVKNEVSLKELEQKAKNLQERALDFSNQTSRFNISLRKKEKLKWYISIVLLFVILLLFILSIFIYFKSQLSK